MSTSTSTTSTTTTNPAMESFQLTGFWHFTPEKLKKNIAWHDARCKMEGQPSHGRVGIAYTQDSQLKASLGAWPLFSPIKGEPKSGVKTYTKSKPLNWDNRDVMVEKQCVLTHLGVERIASSTPKEEREMLENRLAAAEANQDEVKIEKYKNKLKILLSRDDKQAMADWEAKERDSQDKFEDQMDLLITSARDFIDANASIFKDIMDVSDPEFKPLISSNGTIKTRLITYSKDPEKKLTDVWTLEQYKAAAPTVPESNPWSVREKLLAVPSKRQIYLRQYYKLNMVWHTDKKTGECIRRFEVEPVAKEVTIGKTLESKITKKREVITMSVEDYPGEDSISWNLFKGEKGRNAGLWTMQPYVNDAPVVMKVEGQIWGDTHQDDNELLGIKKGDPKPGTAPLQAATCDSQWAPCIEDLGSSLAKELLKNLDTIKVLQRMGTFKKKIKKISKAAKKEGREMTIEDVRKVISVEDVKDKIATEPYWFKVKKEKTEDDDDDDDDDAETDHTRPPMVRCKFGRDEPLATYQGSPVAYSQVQKWLETDILPGEYHVKFPCVWVSEACITIKPQLVQLHIHRRSGSGSGSGAESNGNEPQQKRVAMDIFDDSEEEDECYVPDHAAPALNRTYIDPELGAGMDERFNSPDSN